VLLHHALLGLSAAALGAASLRVASLAAPSGLERAVAAAPIAAAGAAAEALALGVGGLAGESLALAVGALLAWVAARALLPAPAVGAAAELIDWWRRLAPDRHALVGALTGAAVALLAWFLRFPVVGLDGVFYHLPVSASWVQSGHAGGVVAGAYGLPVGNYPLTNELLMAWAMGISKSLVALTVWTPLLAALMAIAAWLGLRTLGVPRGPGALTVAALCTLPLVVTHLNEPSTDIAALAWLVCGGALCAASAQRPGLLAPAILALGLAVGTKATALPLSILSLALALYAGRAELRRLALPLGLAALAAVIVGGVWYLRNLVDHGSPLWPFVALPWGDSLPAHLEHLRYSLLDRPALTLEGHLDDYAESLSGALALLGGALLAALLVRRRAVLTAAAATGLTLLVWLNAPVTGRGDIPALDGLALTTTRYLLPVVAAAALTLALAARERRAAGWIATLLLACALAWCVVDDLGLGFPLTPPASLLALGGGAGAAVGWVTGRLAGWTSARLPARPARLAGMVGVVATVAAATALAAPASGYVSRHAATWPHPIAQLTGWFAPQAEFARGDQPVGMAVNLDGALVGDRLQHRLELISARASCREVGSRLKRGWVVISVFPRLAIRDHPKEVFPELGSARGCLRSRRPVHVSPPYRVYRGFR
jgi:hypothetical protein